MDDTEALHHEINLALNDLAMRLGGDTEEGGPVENATQIKDRGDLGVLLTDVNDRVLGRVWVEYGGTASFSSGDPAAGLTEGDGRVGVEARVRTEVVDPPQAIDLWVDGR